MEMREKEGAKTGSGRPVTSPKPKSLAAVTHFAKVSRQVVLRRMAPDQCFSSRVFWAGIYCSWCGPEATDDGMVVEKDARGYIKRDRNGQPIPAQQKFLLKLLALKPGLKGRMSRTLARLSENGQIWTNEAGTMYVDPEPPAFENLDPVASTGNWKIADQIIRIDNLPDDPVASTETIQWLNEISTAWKNDLKVVRTRYRMLLVQAVSDGRIIIDKKRREVDKKTSSSSAVSTTSSNGAGKAEEDYGEFKKLYPKAHFDEDKAKPAFLKMPAAVRQQVIERLVLYVGCDRWKAEGGRWIPLASNWLKSYEAEPPPLITPGRPVAGGYQSPTNEQVQREIREQEDLRNFLRARSKHG